MRMVYLMFQEVKLWNFKKEIQSLNIFTILSNSVEPSEIQQKNPILLFSYNVQIFSTFVKSFWN